MSENETVQKGWTAVQVYTLSAICLLVGLALGFLFHGSKAPQNPTAAVATAGNPAGALPPNAGQPSEQDMKRMADKQVAPLLEQLKTDSNNVDLLAKVAHYYMMARQFNDAATYYTKAAQVQPSAKMYTELSVADYYGGSGEKAIDALNQAIKLDPKYADALFNLGMLKWQVNNDPKGAVECWQTLLKTNPNHPKRADVEKLISEVKKHASMPAGTKTDKPAM